MTLRVYPSDVMDEYVTSDPVIFTVAAVLIFVFTSLVFLLYDRLVERRQKKVMSTAVQFSYRFVALPASSRTASSNRWRRTRMSGG
jgi:hypothetical protein